MITCPWCGTSYLTFQPNCKNCGGPLPAQETIYPEHDERFLVPPPPAPRPISDQYRWKLMLAEGWSIAGIVLAFVGGVFGMVGLGLIAGIVTAFVGIIFLPLGIAFLAAGAGIIIWRYQEKGKIVNVLRYGAATVGEIHDVQENLSVEINNRHPWNIDYQFTVGGQLYRGKVSTLQNPGSRLQPGKPSYVLYMPTNPELNALYPHP